MVDFNDSSEYFLKYPWVNGAQEFCLHSFPYLDEDPRKIFENPTPEVRDLTLTASKIIKEGMTWKTEIKEFKQIDARNLAVYAILKILLNVLNDEYIISATAALICNHSKHLLNLDMQHSPASIKRVAQLCDLSTEADRSTIEGVLLELCNYCYSQFISSINSPDKPVSWEELHQIPFIHSIITEVNNDLRKVSRFPSLYRTRLNLDQLPAVYPTSGSLLVIAGAGTGKTRVITYKVAWLIDQGFDPASILLLTFTRNAAKEMIGRVETLLGKKPEGLLAGTFHSVANKVLREYHASIGLEPNFSILDEKDQKKLLKTCIPHEHITSPLYFDRSEFHGGVVSADKLVEGEIDAEFEKEVQSLAPVLKDYIRISSFSKFLSWSISKVMDEHYPKLKSFKKLVEYVLGEYEKRKHEINALDFDDLLVNFIKFLRSRASLPFSQGIKHILVDEFQDVNAIQAEIVRTLFTHATSLTVVGDDDQTIYAFRGASIAHIINLPGDIPDTEIATLSLNYRSRPEILTVTNRSISHNEIHLSAYQELPKTLLPERPSGIKPFLCEFENHHSELSFICNEIERLHETGVSYKEIAVLFRSIKAFREKVITPLEKQMLTKQIPYKILGGKTLFDRKEVRLLLAFLSIFSNQKNKLAWDNLLGILDGMGDKTISIVLGALFPGKKSQSAQITDYFGQGKPELSLNAKSPIERFIWNSWSQKGISTETRNSLEGLKRIFYKLALDPVTQKLRGDVLGGLSLGKFTQTLSSFLLTLKKVTKPNKSGHSRKVQDNFSQIEDLISNYSSITDFLTDISLILNPLDKEDTDSMKKRDSDYVAISTVHQFKGLERRVIFLPMLITGSFPTRQSLKSKNATEEERRIFYVACTRAQDLLYLSYARVSPFGKNSEVSCFVNEIEGDNLVDKIIDSSPHTQLFTTWSLRKDPNRQ